jgi:hypothetical protein
MSESSIILREGGQDELRGRRGKSVSSITGFTSDQDGLERGVLSLLQGVETVNWKAYNHLLKMVPHVARQLLRPALLSLHTPRANTKLSQ